MPARDTDTTTNPIQYRVTGMDCSSCATKIETATRKIDGVQDVRVSIATQIMTLHVNDADTIYDVENAITGLGYQLSRMNSSEEEGEIPKELKHVAPAYKRALWIVVLLNMGYGIAEMIGGFFSGSQALKADALDFLGDGSITFLGILAIRWSFAARARSAITQGIFLGLLGVGVLVNTLYRIFVLQTPEPGLMGILGFIALIINILAAVVLIPHRTGDANVRAVWLFSRNDALGNLAVVIAAGIVFWTKSPWPDLLAAGVISSLFLHSSWSIIRDARKDLEQQSTA